MQIVGASQDHLNEILAWLEQEELETGEGFYCNKEVIERSLISDDLYCAIQEQEVIAFAVLTRKSEGADISILEVKPSHRNLGVGRVVAESCIERLFDSGAAFICVQCSPHASEPFWLGLGFLPTNRPLQNYAENPQLVLTKKP